MSEKRETASKSSSDLESLEARLEAARAKKPAPKEANETGKAIGTAWRLSVELVVAVLVGGVIGYGIDYFAKTAPWFMLAGLIFGFAAGVKNSIRLANRMNEEVTDLGQDLPDGDWDEDEI